MSKSIVPLVISGVCIVEVTNLINNSNQSLDIAASNVVEIWNYRDQIWVVDYIFVLQL